MRISKENIMDALTGEDSSTLDGNGCDWAHDILEQADPEKVAAIRKELVANNWGLALPQESFVKPEELESEEARKIRKDREERRYQRSLPWHFIQD